ncbi:DUF3467 domain-containing protein [Albimonas sp. CAU 1670]|uniref:DUF3467 domain-containing protein n=1 Tax=Albimonas sp. CAU 1670 TaxID=3032599 RepID=UPI0023DACC7F|nr:DUF3467 domain-containing protein [Albimonas sp. CAU 1670]MDF2234975.1 DUF3467 domain-containing protein [Albimonas sp. CAU 1670]
MKDGDDADDKSGAESEARGGRRTVRWDDSRMQTSFANVVNVQSTREQVDLFFGTNKTWNPSAERSLTVDLSHRIMLSPLAAKRLSQALNGVLREYEARYGKLEVE